MDHDDLELVTMPFGRYKNCRIFGDEIPTGYLRWLIGECDIKSPTLKAAIDARLEEDDPGHAFREMARETDKFFKKGE